MIAQTSLIGHLCYLFIFVVGVASVSLFEKDGFYITTLYRNVSTGIPCLDSMFFTNHLSGVGGDDEGIANLKRMEARLYAMDSPIEQGMFVDLFPWYGRTDLEDMLLSGSQIADLYEPFWENVLKENVLSEHEECADFEGFHFSNHFYPGVTPVTVFSTSLGVHQVYSSTAVVVDDPRSFFLQIPK